jgi:hypothetical protein
MNTPQKTEAFLAGIITIYFGHSDKNINAFNRKYWYNKNVTNQRNFLMSVLSTGSDPIKVQESALPRRN